MNDLIDDIYQRRTIKNMKPTQVFSNPHQTNEEKFIILSQKASQHIATSILNRVFITIDNVFIVNSLYYFCDYLIKYIEYKQNYAVAYIYFSIYGLFLRFLKDLYDLYDNKNELFKVVSEVVSDIHNRRVLLNLHHEYVEYKQKYNDSIIEIINSSCHSHSNYDYHQSEVLIDITHDLTDKLSIVSLMIFILIVIVLFWVAIKIVICK